jgi:hypothetical protein
VYVAPVGVLRGYLIDSPYSSFSALKRSVSLSDVEAPYLLSAYRKPVYLYFTSLDGLASSASTSAVRRYAAGEYVDAYAQYTASNRAFKFEAVERPADWFFRVSPVRRFYEYGRLYDGLSYSKSISPLLAVQLTAYRPRIRYVSYTTSDYVSVYGGAGYTKAVVLVVSGLEDVYSIPLHVKLSYVFDVINDVLTDVLGVKPVYIQINAVEQVFGSFSYRLASRAYAGYEGLYESVAYTRTVSPLLAVQLTAYRPKIRYASYSVSDYYNTYDYIGYVKSVSPMLLLQVSVYRPRFRYASFSVSEFYLLYESSEVRTRPVYSAGSYEVLYEPVYRPTVRYYNVYFVNVYRYANIYDLERLYESFRYEKKSASFLFTSYEGLYEGFIAKRG